MRAAFQASLNLMLYLYQASYYWAFRNVIKNIRRYCAVYQSIYSVLKSYSINLLPALLCLSYSSSFLLQNRQQPIFNKKKNGRTWLYWAKNSRHRRSGRQNLSPRLSSGWFKISVPLSNPAKNGEEYVADEPIHNPRGQHIDRLWVPFRQHRVVYREERPQRLHCEV